MKDRKIYKRLDNGYFMEIDVYENSSFNNDFFIIKCYFIVVIILIIIGFFGVYFDI